MSKQKNQVHDLLAAIKRQPTPSAHEKPAPEKPVADKVTPAPELPPPTTQWRGIDKPSQTRRGKAAQYWMYDEDRKLIRELSAWLAGQGLRPSDSLVIRAALRLAKTGSGLLEAYHEAAKLDGRIQND